MESTVGEKESHLARLSENAKSKKTYIVSKGLMTRIAI